MSRIVCTTYYDTHFAVVGDICLRTMRHYAERHGFELAYLPGLPCERPLPWYKILVMQELFRRGAEFVFWIDADALIVDASRSIEEVIEPGKDLYVVLQDDGERKHPNFGISLLRNSEWTVKFLTDVWNLTQYIDHKWWENAAVKHLLSHEDFTDHGIDAHRQPIPLDRVKWLDNEWNSIPEVFGGRYASSHPIIKHYAGFSMKQRRRGMLRDLHGTPIGQQSAPAAKDLIRSLYSSKIPRPC